MITCSLIYFINVFLAVLTEKSAWLYVLQIITCAGFCYKLNIHGFFPHGIYASTLESETGITHLFGLLHSRLPIAIHPAVVMWLLRVRNFKNEPIQGLVSVLFHSNHPVFVQIIRCSANLGTRETTQSSFVPCQANFMCHFLPTA